jgi:small-conductance mechanosensitive channel
LGSEAFISGIITVFVCTVTIVIVSAWIDLSVTAVTIYIATITDASGSVAVTIGIITEL